MNQDCIFCKIIKKELPADIVFETDNIIVIKDKFPKATHHYLVMPKDHIKDTREIGLLKCCFPRKMLEAANQVAEDKKIEDFKLVINNGHGAGQRVFHLHMHLLAGKNIEQV